MDKKILNEIYRNKELMGLNEQVIDAINLGIGAGKTFTMRKGDNNEWGWVEDNPTNKDHTIKQEFDDYVIYHRLKVPLQQRSQVQDFIINQVAKPDGKTVMLTNQEVAEILNEKYKEGQVLNPQVTSDNGYYNYSYYFKL